MIESTKYLTLFQEAASQLDTELLEENQIEIVVVEMLNCVVLKLFKRSWANPEENPLTARSRIFCSIWVSGDAGPEQKILYNIHAFKLRELHGYKIQSRKFATLFRSYFKPFEVQWPNVSVKYGPVTLMEGWINIDADNIKADVVQLAANFLQISQLVDKTLFNFKQ